MATEYNSISLDLVLAYLAQRTGLTPPSAVHVSLGGCASAIGTTRQGAMRRSAHAHTDATDTHRGWLCFKSTKPTVLFTSTGKPSKLLIHEWAHAAVREGHTRRWREVMRAMGQHAPLAGRYAPRGSEQLALVRGRERAAAR